jgi:hypothetical protein
MTEQTDPETVARDVAREAMRLASQRRDDLDTAISRFGGLGDRPEDPDGLRAFRIAYSRLYDAARSQMRIAAVAVSWPDERLVQDDREITLDELIDAAHRRRPGFDEDVRAVARLFTINRHGVDWGQWHQAHQELYERFADRIADLERRDPAPAESTDGGGES